MCTKKVRVGTMSEDIIYRLLFEHSSQGILLLRGKKIILVNQSFADMVGYTIDELLDFSIEETFNLFHPQDREAALSKFQDLLTGKDLHINYESHYMRQNGETGWWQITLSTIDYRDQPAVLGVFVDITERKKTEANLEAGRNLMTATLDVLPVGVCLTDEGGYYRMMNDAYCAIYEYDREEMLGQHYSVIMPQDQIALANAHYTRLLSGDIGIPVERKRQRKNGSIVYIEAANALVEGESGQKMVITTVRDITERKETEEALRESEERSALVLEGSQLGYWDWNIETGQVQRNARWAEMLGYTLQEIEFNVKQWTDLHHPDDRAAAWQSIQDHLEGRTPEHRIEYRMRTKNGGYKWILDQAKVVKRDSQGKPIRMSGTHTDITERKRGEEIIRLRLRLVDYTTTHTLYELMQKALDEIGELTDSPIGFYHFVAEDQNSLSLQAWSTRTLAEFCEMEGERLHYSIEEAGVWVDCVRQRKPIVHNDYAALTHRKGLPDGHADVIRELVVPTLRDGRVVAILGVGNKPFEYDEQDVGLVSYIADLVWSIIEQKRTNEQIQQLNSQLERLAMMDELTDLMNRRAFFIQGEKEISRAQRQQTSLSLLMLDVDVFKKVNDQYGHAAGDYVLQHVSRKIVENVRDMDMVARMGGEEFSVLLPNTESEDAVKLAERVRQAVEQESCQFQDQLIGVTVSIGVASYSKNISNLEAILKHADDSMYRAKNRGRNRVVFVD